MKLLRHDCGTAIAIGIASNSKIEIQECFYAYWNHGATSGELHWVKDDLAYFWTTPENLKKCLIEIALFRLLDLYAHKNKGKKRGLMPEAIERGERAFYEFETDDFLGSGESPDIEIKPYNMGYLDYFSPNLDFY